MWSWLREVQRPWQEEPFNRALFEDNLDFGDEKVASEWPLSPNKAGKAYLDLVKGEWNSTMTLENVENIENLRVFKGKEIHGPTRLRAAGRVNRAVSEFLKRKLQNQNVQRSKRRDL